MTRIIGITGNIATGKSVVRRMLANSGALEIDADVLAHRMLYPNGPAYQPVVHAFGEEILAENGHISREKLGKIVFNNPKKLTLLESLIHPAVIKSISSRVQKSKTTLVVVEAIKLLEAGLGDICDSIWVSHASVSHQLERLLQTRKMTETTAMTRINAQPPQSAKLARADVVINTEGTFQHTWQQIQNALNDTIQPEKETATRVINVSEGCTGKFSNALLRNQLVSLWEMHSHKDLSILYETLGMHMLLPLLKDDVLAALMIWDNWNFTAAFNHVVPEVVLKESTACIFEAFQNHSQSQQCEILLLSDAISHQGRLEPAEYGYNYQPIGELSYPAWQQAVYHTVSEQNTHVWVKELTQPLEMESKFDD